MRGLIRRDEILLSKLSGLKLASLSFWWGKSRFGFGG